MSKEKTSENEKTPEASVFAGNLSLILARSQSIMQEFMLKNSANPAKIGTGDIMHISNAFTEWFASLLNDPQKIVELQLSWWRDSFELWQYTTQKFLGHPSEPVITPDSKDRRFKDQAWQESIIFDFIKQSYLLSARFLQQSVHKIDELSPNTLKKIDFYTRQFVDAMSPSNFLLTNPEVLKVTLETGGENIVKGLGNMLEDLENSKSSLRVSMTDMNAFAVGKNLATTKGKVIYKNELMELIQYEALTDKVAKTPILVVPPWINKYYILDLQEENSFLRWLVANGHSLFVISWVNPDEKLSHKKFDDYMLEGTVRALEEIEKATDEKEVNTIGYCLGGTLLAITIAYLRSKKQEKRVKSATYLTTMIDFSESGELSVFIDEEQISALEKRMSEKGYLDGDDMAVTFNMLRANDLIWSFVVNNYLLGKDPFPFDLLYWNSDSTRMPAQMHSFYLRQMYQNNLLKEPGGIKIAGVSIHLEKITTPSYLLSTREDHIAPWKSTFASTKIYNGEIKFVLAASGHIAGVINPPSKNKYSYWLNDNLCENPDEWFSGAQEIKGSWWNNWLEWLKPFEGETVPARVIGNGHLFAKDLVDAPGTYVMG